MKNNLVTLVSIIGISLASISSFAIEDETNTPTAPISELNESSLLDSEDLSNNSVGVDEAEEEEAGTDTDLILLNAEAEAASLKDEIEKAKPLTPQSLKDLVDDGLYEKAYAQGQDMLFDYEGDPEFDLLYATAAIEEGHYNEAIFTFNRLLEEKPNNVRYQLELARAYFEAGEREKSKPIFESVLASNPDLPENVEEKVLSYLSAIDSKNGFDDPTKAETLKGFVGVAAGYDSNANAASDTDIISQYFNGNAIPTENFSEEEETAYLSYQVAGAYVKPLGKRSALDLKVYLANRKNKSELSNLDTSSAYFEIGNRRKFEKGLANFSLRYTGVTFGDDDLYDLLNFKASWLQPVAWKYADSLNIAFSTGALRYSAKKNELRDIDTTNFAIGLTKQVNKLVHGLGFIFVFDEAQGYHDYIANDDNDTAVQFFDVPADHYSRIASGFNYSLSYLYNSQTIIYGNLSYLNSQYKDEDHFFFDNGQFTKRDGDQIALTLGSTYNWTKALQLKANLTVQETTSELAIYEYSRNKIEVGAGYQL